MRRFFSFVAALVALGPALPADAGSSKKPDTGVSFHIETTEGEDPKMVFQQVAAGKVRYFRRSAELITNDIVAFSPFPADDGLTYGAVCQLNRGAAGRLSNLSAANKGSWLLAMVNGRIVDAVIIDKQVEDGLIVIWKGITVNEVKAFDKIRPRIGEDAKQWKKRKKEK